MQKKSFRQYVEIKSVFLCIFHKAIEAHFLYALIVIFRENAIYNYFCGGGNQINSNIIGLIVIKNNNRQNLLCKQLITLSKNGKTRKEKGGCERKKNGK